jgi:enoyl-[acyl-carrier-protein] reductase (NADH)
VIKDVLLAAQPTKEFVTVEEIAGLALYLTSDLARSITGAILAIDGGWTGNKNRQTSGATNERSECVVPRSAPN